MDSRFISLVVVIVLYSTFEADGISQRHIIYIQSLIEKFSGVLLIYVYVCTE